MKKRIFSIFCVLCLGLLPATALANEPTDNWTDSGNYDISWYSEGTATAYNISSAAELAGLAVLVNGLNEQTATDFSGVTVTLTADIDLSSHYWTPIGTDTNNYFKGTFDGGDHTISNLTIDTNASYVGLFGATSGATLKNVTLDNPQVQNSATGTSNTGALVGYMVGNGTVEYCAVTNGSVSSDGQRVGGLIGYIYAGTVRYCYNLETEVRSSYSTTDYVNGVAGETRNYSYLCSSFSYVSNQKELKASNTANYAAYLSETPTERTGTSGGQHGFTADQFQDGTVAYFLRTGFYSGVSYEDWGQAIGTDDLPEWNGEAVESLKYAHLGSSGTDEVAYAYFNALTQGDNNTYYIENTSDWIAFVKLVKVDKVNDADAIVEEGAVIDFSQFGTLTNKSTYSYLVIADKNSDLSYTGTFIGNGCTVKGVSYSGTMEFALFGTIGEGGKVSGITLEEPKITGTTNGAYNIAGIASHNYGAIENCHVKGGAISTIATTAAGIAAESFGTVKNCTNSADITAKYEVAGIVATSNSTNGNTSETDPMVIEGCSNSGTITATNKGYSCAGGIFGGKDPFSSGYPYGTISKCFNTGDILGQNFVGGIVGYSIKTANASAANVTIENCYNTGAIGDANITGVAGGISAGTNSSVTNCFNMGDVTGTNAQPIVANGQGVQAWSVNSYASCEVNGPASGSYLYYGEDDGAYLGPKDEQGRYCRGSGKRTDAEMASGEVAYLLQQEQENGEQVWSQRIGEDNHPVLVINGEPAPVVQITVMLVEDGNEPTELTKCYTNLGSKLSAYPTPEEPGAVYTFYTEAACANKIDTTEKTYDGDTIIYAKVTELIDVTVSGIDVSGKPYDGLPVGYTGPAKAMNGATDVTEQVDFDYSWYSINGSSETLLTSAPADAGSYKLVVSVVSNTYTGQQVVEFKITQKAITAAVTGSVTKEYDGDTTVPSKNDLFIKLDGLVDADKGSVTASAGSYAYGSAGTGTGITITATGVTLSGDRASNYQLTGTVTGSVGNITAIQIKELTSPTAPVLTEYYSNASEVIAELPTTTTGTTTSGGSVSVTLEWNFSGTSYNSAPGATNSFTWTATAPENYEFASGVDTTREITVTNKSADSPTITGTDRTVTYDGSAINVSTMFTGVPDGSNPTYSIVTGSETTGTGTLSGTTLTVTKAGTFRIKVTTEAVGNYAAGEATAILTVNKGSFTATVTMDGYAQGETPRTPSVSFNPGNGNVTYYYSETNTTSDGIVWSEEVGRGLNVGTYYMYAVIAATDLYESCTTSTTPFKVTEAASSVVAPTAKDLTYTGKSQELIEPGSIAGGTMVYSLSENGEYSETIPTRINAGTYYVWYKAEGDTQAIDKVSVTIQKAVIVSLNIPETYQLTKPYSSGDDVLDLLQSLYDPAVGTTKDGGEIPVNVPWWGRDIVFDSRPGKTNNFTWSIIITGSYVPQNYTFQADMIGSDGNVSGEIVVYNIPEEGAYTVTLNNVGTGSYGAGSYAAGTEVTIHAGDREGYVFIGWSTEDVVLNDPCSPVTTFTMPDCDVVVEALWYKEEPSHSVTLPTWDVIVEDCSHGTVEPWPEEAKMTTTITVTVTPDKGYELGSLIVTDESGNELELTDKGDGVFTFRMPNSDVTIEVTFQPVSDSSTSGDLTITAPAGWVNPYTDVAANAWYYNAVGYASANGLMSGTSATTFSPNTAMTRAMIVTVLARFAGVDTTTGDTWYDAGQQWAVANGISDGTALDRDITRQELVTMLWRYAGSPAMNVPELALIGSYPDSADVSAWAQNAFAWAISKGIIEGRDGLLAPDSGATRAEAATILARFHLLTK